MLPNVEYIKTLINGLKEFVNSKIKLVRNDIDSLPQADWNQNDSTAKDYVKNRPGGYDVATPEKIISEWRMAGYNYVTIELSEPLVKGRSYRLTFSENADYSNPVFDSEVVASISDSEGSIDITVKGYASVMQPVTYPEDPAYYSCNNDVRSGYCRLIALANTETVKIPDKYTNAITYTPQTLTDAQKKQARENMDAASDFVIKTTMGSGHAITLDKTFEQIQEAINDGKKVLVDMALGSNHALLPLIANTPDRVLFAAIGPGSPFSTVSSVMASGNRVYFNIMEMPTLDPNGIMPQVPMDSAPTEDMEIATKKYVDDKEFILQSTTPNSTKKFKITVDDSGTITTMEV